VVTLIENFSEHKLFTVYMEDYFFGSEFSFTFHFETMINISNTGYCIEEQTGQRNEEQKTEK
jgi:hypothetical protein